MNKTKLMLLNKHISSSNDGVILISMSIGIFLIISIFTFFLMKLVVKEHNISMFHTLDIKTRNLAHSALGRGIFQFNDFRNISTQTGNLNNGEYEISYDGINDENNDPLPYSHYTMLKSKAEINDANRKTRIFLSSFPTGFNPAFYGENSNNSHFNNGNNINGGHLVKKDGNLYYNGTLIPSEGIAEKMPVFNNIYDDEIIWTQNNVETNTSNSGGNQNNKYLSFDGSNDYVKINFTTNTNTTTTENIIIDFEGKGGQLNDGYKDMDWHNRMYVLNGNNYSNSGYKKAVNSGSQVLYNAWNQQNVYFESEDGSEFNFVKLYAAAAWCADEVLTLKGYKNGSLKHTRTMDITDSEGRWSDSDENVAAMNDIDKIEFSNTCWHWAIDDITLQKSTTSSSTTTILPEGDETRTVAAWVKPTDNTDHWAFVQWGKDHCTGKIWGMGRRSQKLILWGACKDWITNLSVPKDEWSFVVLRYNGTKVRAYVNGSWEEKSMTGFDTKIGELFIGATTTDNGSSYLSYFKGGIDEVAVWNESLSNAEILALYNNGAGRDATINGGGYSSKDNLKGYWKFNEGTGSTVYDASGNGKNGTRYGASWMTGSHTQAQPSPLKFNAGTQLNLNSPNCGSDHTSLCMNNKIAVNQNIIFTDTDITGNGVIIATGTITVEQNSTIAGGVTLIANEIEINNSSVGNSSLFNSTSGPVIFYTEDGGSINSSNISGLMINYDTNNSGSYVFNNSTVNGAILNYGSNFQLNNYTSILGSVVSNYLVTINSNSSITKGNLPSFYGINVGLSPSVVPGSYLEY